MTRARPGRRRQRGTIDELPSGTLWVRVYGGADPVTGRRHDLVEVIPAGPKAATLAEEVRTRLLNQVDEKRCSDPALSAEDIALGYKQLAPFCARHCNACAARRPARVRGDPRRWVIERSSAWLTAQRRRARDYERDSRSPRP